MVIKAIILLALSLPLSGQLVSLEEALDSSDLTWSTAGEVKFSGTKAPIGIDEDLAIAIINKGETAELSTSLPGPGIIDFWINGGDFFGWSAYLNGQRLNLARGSWPFGFKVEGDGAHTFTIRHHSTWSESQTITIDGVIFLPEAIVSLEDSLDQEGQAWTSPDTTKWVGSPYFSQDGSDAAWIGGLEYKETSSLKTTIHGPAEFSFWWRRTQDSYVRGDLRINGEILQEITSPLPYEWNQVIATVGPGEHEIEFRAEGYPPERVHPATGMWLDQFKVVPLDQGVLIQFHEDTLGARTSEGEVTLVKGVNGGQALRVAVDHLSSFQLYWPLLPSDKARQITFQHQGISTPRVSSAGAFATLSEAPTGWKTTTLRIPPGQDAIRLYLHNYTGETTVLKMDNLQIEDINTVPLRNLLGPLSSNITTEGWNGWPLEGRMIAGAPTAGATISGTVRGPGILKFEANESSQFRIEGGGLNLWPESATTYSHFIPAGEHPFKITTNNYSESWTTIKNLRFEPIPTIPLAQATGNPELVFTQSQNSPFWGDPEVGIRANITAGKKHQLTATISGPALVRFRRKLLYTNQTKLTANRGKSVIIINVGPQPIDPGTWVTINGHDTLRQGSSGIFSFISQDAAPREPMSFDKPHLMTSVIGRVSTLDFSNSLGVIGIDSGSEITRTDEVRFGRFLKASPDGSNQYELYLGPGDHEVTWHLGIATDSRSIREFQLSDLQVLPVRHAYAVWADEQWIAAPEVENAVTKLGPWQDPMADPDQDGHSNAMEYAYGSDPRSRLSYPPSPRLNNSGTPSVFWPNPPSSAPLVKWKVLFSDDLINWSTEGVTGTLTPQGLRSQAINPTPKGYFKLEPDVTE